MTARVAVQAIMVETALKVNQVSVASQSGLIIAEGQRKASNPIEAMTEYNQNSRI